MSRQLPCSSAAPGCSPQTSDVAVQVGLAGPSGSGKTAFSQKIQTVLTGQADFCVAKRVMPAFRRAAAARQTMPTAFCCFIVYILPLVLQAWPSDLLCSGVSSCWVCSAVHRHNKPSLHCLFTNENCVAGCAVLSMDNYNDGSRVIDSNFDGEAGCFTH